MPPFPRFVAIGLGFTIGTFSVATLGQAREKTARPSVKKNPRGEQPLKPNRIQPGRVHMGRFLTETGIADQRESPMRAPTPETDLVPMTISFTGTLGAGDQNYPIELTLEVKEDPAGWAVRETAKLSIDVAVDQTTLEKGSLIVKKRAFRFGSVTANATFNKGKANGQMMMGAQSRPIESDTGGPVFADGAGAYIVVGRLPLTDGYAVSFRNFDLQSQKPTLKQLKVLGTESVTIPAGTFETFKVEISDDASGRKTLLWIAKDSRNPVRIKSEGGGPKVVLEFTK